MTALRGSLLAILVSLSSPGQAADIYRWVDEQGRTHIADVVPERYRGVAVRIDSKALQPSARQRAEATERAAKDRARSSEIEAARRARSQTSTASSTSTGTATRPAASAADSECERLWNEFHESQACFAPYHGRHGIKAEAYSKCKEVLNPSQKCGPAKYIAP